MTHQEFLTTVATIAALTGALALLEVAIPFAATRDRAKGRAPANLSLAALVLGMNWALMTGMGALLAWLDLSGSSLVPSLGLPFWAEVVLAVLVLDLATWLAHRLMHVFPVLWRLHRVHHADPFIDVTTSFRQHPGEGLWRFFWTYAPALLLGLSPYAVVIYRTASAIQALAEHVNVSLPLGLDRALTWFWVSPNMHKLHHSAARAQSDTNYGNLFSFFDRLFGTFTPSDRAVGIDYGLPEEVPADQAKSLPALLRLPFAAERPADVAPAESSRSTSRLPAGSAPFPKG